MDKLIKEEDLELLNTKEGLKKLFKAQKDNETVEDVLKDLKYEKELSLLQAELVKLQRWVQEEGKRIMIIFEGRDAAGKGGAILRFSQHLSPRAMRVVALPKPSDLEKGQWFFQRYVNQLPNPGEIVFFDRSWYNRAVVEPVMGFCTESQYKEYMLQVPDFEHMLHEDGIIMIKFWFSIDKEEQAERFKERKADPLKQWKLSPIDERAQEMWEKISEYKEEMFVRTHTSYSPWVIVNANNKKKARLESMRYVLSNIDYTEKSDKGVSLQADPDVVFKYHRSADSLD